MNLGKRQKTSVEDVGFLHLLSINGSKSIQEWMRTFKDLKALQEENVRLKRMFADLSLDHRILNDII